MIYVNAMRKNQRVLYFDKFTVEDKRQAFLDTVDELDAITSKDVHAICHRRIEVVSEQVYFAQELIDSIEEILKGETRAVNIKQRIKLALENTMFER